MGYFTLNIKADGKSVVIVGGGRVAERKCRAIAGSGANITVISPDLTPLLAEMAAGGTILHVSRKYKEGDLSGAFLVIAATDDRETNRMIGTDAARTGLLTEIVNDPVAGDVTSPAVIRRGDLAIAIFTNNRAPALAAAIKRQLAPLFGDEYAKTVTLLGILREKLLTDGGGSTYNKQVLCELADELPALLASGSIDKINELLGKHFGNSCTLATFDAAIGDNT